MSDDARWGDDPRDREDGSRDLGRGGRGGSDSRERDHVDPGPYPRHAVALR